jgi:hypothetical protein
MDISRNSFSVYNVHIVNNILVAWITENVISGTISRKKQIYEAQDLERAE